MSSDKTTNEALRGSLTVKQAGKRRCTDCGKPTHNYRCEKCWKKRRGFGFEDSGDPPVFSKGDGAATQRRKKPAPFRRDEFVPLTPRLALPDRQAEFFAKKEKEKEKEMKQQTYTVGELATLLGVSPKDVANAKYAKSKNPTPGSKMAAVREGMSARGITWEQVANGPRGKKVKAEAVKAAPDPVVEPAAPAPVIDAVPDAPETDLSEVVADMEPEDAMPLPPEVEPLPSGRIIATGAVMSLEDVLAELRRILPGATLSIPL